MSAPVQQKAADVLTGAAITTYAGVSLTDLNLYLETASLALSVIAALFAVFFHVRRWWRERQAGNSDAG